MFESGNIGTLIASSPERRGWFVGSFIPVDSFFHSDDVELKWSLRKAGEIHIGSVSEVSKKTITILIDGEAKMIFPSHQKEVLLDSPGSYVTFDTSTCTHELHAITDCTILTVRF